MDKIIGNFIAGIIICGVIAGIISGIIIGYAWCTYNHKGYQQTVINYPCIAQDTVKLPHKTSRKELTRRY